MVDLARVYARHATRFDRARMGSAVERPYLDQLCALSPSPGSALDLGCGSGEPIARQLVERGYSVTGVDMVEEMLALGRERLPQATWLRADMRALALPTRFDLVIAWDSFFHLPPNDQRAMLETFRQHTAQGGALLFNSGTREGGGIGGDMFGDPLYHASLDTDEYRSILEQHGYRVISHNIKDPACGGRTVWIAQLDAG